MQSLARARWIGTALTLALIALLAMQETGAVISDVAVHGVTYSAGSLDSLFGVWSAGKSMNAWATASCSGIPIKSWLWWNLGFDVPFILGYTVAAIGTNRRWDLRNGGWIVLLVASDLVEDVLTLVGIARMPSGIGSGDCQTPVTYHVTGLFGALSAATTVKWLAAGALVIRTAWIIWKRPDHRGRFHLVVKALIVQRFQVVVVMVLAALLLLHGGPILEQGIDVERAWVINAHHWSAIGPAIWAIVFIGLLACALRYLSSVRIAPFQVKRTDDEKTNFHDEPEPALVVTLRGEDWDAASWPTRIKWWAQASVASLWQSKIWIAAVAALSLLVAVAGLTPYVRVYWAAAMWLLIVLGAIPVLSAALSLVNSPESIEPTDDKLRAKAYQIGRVVSWSVVAILLVSVCRSLVAPMVLLPGQQTACIVVSSICALAACAYMYVVLSHNEPKLRDAANPVPSSNPLDPQLVGARAATVAPGRYDDESVAAPVPGLLASIAPAAVLTAICAILLLIWPISVSRVIGMMGIVGLCFIGLTVFYSMLQILAQLTDPPHVFRLLGVRRAPVVGIVLVIGLLATFVATETSEHEIRTPLASAPDTRPTLDTAFTTWLANQSPDCAVTVKSAAGKTLHVQPLMLIAAEGGGIRAAWWTVDVMTSMVSTKCGRDSILLTSGVSGGAIGLGLMATSTTPYADMKKVAGEDALAAATGAMLSRDLVAGSFGVNVRAADGPTGDNYPDRSALIEQTWERQAPALHTPFPAPSGAASVPWHTVFNGTSVGNNCRLLVADINLSPKTKTCDDPANAVPGTYDLFNAHPCDTGLPTSTASLLAGRFPYVTPSGVISNCGKKFSFADQIIDGGYSENSGMDTLDSTLTNLMPTIRQHNATALAATSDATVVVPVVVFLHNTVVASASDVAATPRAKPEPVVPPLDKLSDAGVLAKTSTLLERAADISADWVPDSQAADRSELVQLAAKAVAQQAITVAPQQQPQIALPLGWTLSDGTRSTLDKAFSAYLTCVPDGARTCEQSDVFDGLLRGWGTSMAFPPK